jgi:hypothetical protein
MNDVPNRRQHVEMALCSHVSPVGDPNSDVTMNGPSVAGVLRNESVINVSITQLQWLDEDPQVQ